MLSRPELITDTYLTVLLKQLEIDGYSIFVVDGVIPESEADRILFDVPLDTQEILKRQRVNRPKSTNTENSQGFDDDELKRAIKMSLVENDKDLDAASSNKSLPNIIYDDSYLDENDEFKRAIELSLEVD